MKQHWLDIQSFLSDQKILRAIDDLAIATQFELAGVDDRERRQLAEEATKTLRDFLRRLDEVNVESGKQVVRGVDPRFMELADAFAAARRDRANFKSTLMKAGAGAAISLLEAADNRAKRELLACLDELRRVVEGHQQVDVSAIVEDF
jgi:molecular chaperone GrpE (heat shock protein)